MNAKGRLGTKVVRAVQSPSNPGRWLATLACGHKEWVMRDRKPRRVLCGVCIAVERDGAGLFGANVGEAQ